MLLHSFMHVRTASVTPTQLEISFQVTVANAWPETSGDFYVSALVKGPDAQPMHARLDAAARLQAGEERTFEVRCPEKRRTWEERVISS